MTTEWAVAYTDENDDDPKRVQIVGINQTFRTHEGAQQYLDWIVGEHADQLRADAAEELDEEKRAGRRWENVARHRLAEHERHDYFIVRREITPWVSDVQAELRAQLKQAQAEGVIASFSLRKGGRATLYRPGGERKTYTTSTLDTLTKIDQWRAERKT